MSVKTVALATVFVFGAGLLALYAGWQLDESKKLVRTNVVEQSEEDGTLVIEMKERLGDDFIVLCPEERFQEAFDELRRRYCQELWISDRRDQAASFRSSSLLRSF